MLSRCHWVIKLRNMSNFTTKSCVNMEKCHGLEQLQSLHWWAFFYSQQKSGLPGSMANADQCQSKFWHWSEYRSMSINADQCQIKQIGIDHHWEAFWINQCHDYWHWSALIDVGHWLRESWNMHLERLQKNEQIEKLNYVNSKWK